MTKKIIQGLTLLESENLIVKIMKFESSELYHILKEYKDGNFEHEVLGMKDVLKKYNLNSEQLPNAYSKYHLSKEDIMSIPNDADLGEFIRKKIYQK
jgi:hypothetical protein